MKLFDDIPVVKIWEFVDWTAPNSIAVKDDEAQSPKKRGAEEPDGMVPIAKFAVALEAVVPYKAISI